jgi:hypothetical protein
MEAVMNVRLGRFSETDLVRHDDAIASLVEHLDRVLPISAEEILPVEQNNNAFD